MSYVGVWISFAAIKGEFFLSLNNDGMSCGLGEADECACGIFFVEGIVYLFLFLDVDEVNLDGDGECHLIKKAIYCHVV